MASAWAGSSFLLSQEEIELRERFQAQAVSTGTRVTVPVPPDREMRVRIFPHDIVFAAESADREVTHLVIETLDPALPCEESAADLRLDLDPGTRLKDRWIKRQGAKLAYDWKSLKAPVWVDCPGGFRLHRQKDRRAFEYSGRLLLRREPAALRRKPALQAVNVVPMEEYLLGVVPIEMPANWTLAAYQAQAVAARTYAYFQKSARENPTLDLGKLLPQLADFAVDTELSHPVFHVDDTVRFQVYGGRTLRSPATDQAVISTARRVLTWRGELPQAWFSADNGGYSEDAQAVFEVDAPYAVGKAEPPENRDNVLLQGTPWGPWTYSIAGVALGRKLAAAGLLKPDQEIIGVKLNEFARNTSGRIRSLSLQKRDGQWFTVGAIDFRWATKLRSVMILTAEVHGQGAERTLKFTGRGFGHGVGMSQTGAWKLSEVLGWSWERVLEHYYTGVRIDELGAAVGE